MNIYHNFFKMMQEKLIEKQNAREKHVPSVHVSLFWPLLRPATVLVRIFFETFLNTSTIMHKRNNGTHISAALHTEIYRKNKSPRKQSEKFLRY